MKDPLALASAPAPQAVREHQVAPLANITNLHNRIIGNNHADSSEVKLALLAHLVYLAYVDLKEFRLK